MNAGHPALAQPFVSSGEPMGSAEETSGNETGNETVSSYGEQETGARRAGNQTGSGSPPLVSMNGGRREP